MSNEHEIGAETMASLRRYTEAMISKVLAERGLIPAPVEELSDIGETAANLYWNWRRFNLQQLEAAGQAALAHLAAKPPPPPFPEPPL